MRWEAGAGAGAGGALSGSAGRSVALLAVASVPSSPQLPPGDAPSEAPLPLGSPGSIPAPLSAGTLRGLPAPAHTLSPETELSASPFPWDAALQDAGPGGGVAI